jgi:hypothetical protein
MALLKRRHWGIALEPKGSPPRSLTTGVRGEMARGTFLVLDDDHGLAGCVYVEVTGEFGQLRIALRGSAPRAKGTPDAAARRRTLEILVVNLRTELFPYCWCHGYVETGVRPFPEDEPTKRPCHFVVLGKSLLPS